MLIAIEGIDGAGKSTFIDHIYNVLSKQTNAIKIAIPSNFSTGNKIRKSLFDSDISDMDMKDLFIRDIAYASEKIIRPAMKSRHFVIADRYIHSFIAYQSTILSEEVVNKTMNKFSIKQPDIVVLFDIDPRISLARIKSKKDSIESRSIDTFDKIRAKYLEEARKNPNRWLIIDASLSNYEIMEKINLVFHKVIELKRSSQKTRIIYRNKKNNSLSNIKTIPSDAERIVRRQYQLGINRRNYLSKKLVKEVDIENEIY